jgi:hypothetical protein
MNRFYLGATVFSVLTAIDRIIVGPRGIALLCCLLAGLFATGIPAEPKK